MSKKSAALGRIRNRQSDVKAPESQDPSLAHRLFGVSAPSGRFRPSLAATALIALTLWECPFAALLGIPCPGCGLTRAAVALVQGEWSQALLLHPLSPLILPIVAGALWTAAAPALRTAPDTAAFRGRTALLWALCALSIGVWLARFGGAFGGPVPVESRLAGWIW